MTDEQQDQGVLVTGSALIEDGDRDLYAAAAAHFPTEAHKQDMRGGAKITYLEGEDVISRMNRVFVYGWESEVLSHGINEDADEVWVRLRVTIWRKATLRSIVVEGSKTTTTMSEQLVPIKREQFGSQKLKRARSTGKILDVGFDLKGATTDALKKTVSLLGVGLYLWNKQERELIDWALKEMQQEQRAPQNQPQDGSGRLRRPNLSNRSESGQSAPTSAPAQDSEAPDSRPPQDGKLRINGVEMPDGFRQPFALVDQGKGQTQCREEQCQNVIDPNAEYAIGKERKKGGYVIRRAKEMAGTVLCVVHAAAWNNAVREAQASTAA